MLMKTPTTDPNWCAHCEGSGLAFGFRDVATARGEHDTVDEVEDCRKCKGTGRLASDWPDEETCKDVDISMIDLVRGRF